MQIPLQNGSLLGEELALFREEGISFPSEGPVAEIQLSHFQGTIHRNFPQSAKLTNLPELPNFNQSEI